MNSLLRLWSSRLTELLHHNKDVEISRYTIDQFIEHFFATVFICCDVLSNLIFLILITCWTNGQAPLLNKSE